MLSFSVRLHVCIDADADAADGICIEFAFLLECAFARSNPLNAVALLLMLMLVF